MDNRVGLVFFVIFVLLFAFAFGFGWYALEMPSLVFGILALVGFIVVLAGSLINGALIKNEGGALAPWYFTLAIVVGVVFVWYLTRSGTALGFWT